MESGSNSYEEIRRQRVQDNLKHLEDLGISTISKSLLEVAKTEYKLLKFNTSPKSKKNFEALELRRSSRARNPAPLYRDEVDDFRIQTYHKRNNKNQYAGRDYTGRISSYEEQVRAVKRGEELQSCLSHPSFIKTMVRSHVSSCFWLGLPSKFCKEHLPPHELQMVLEDEQGSEYEAIYIGKRTGLSGGWRAFAVEHKLEDGDAVVFELTEAARFKIYVIKAIEPELSQDTDDKVDEDEDTEGITKAAETTESLVEMKGLSVSEEHRQMNEPVKQVKRARKRKN